ncbi:hypothetical protein [Roseateles sp.]|uniref:hypothetical protein n=1 Tax=Roseateles sp. TaxID=1971397 RepID=UPI0039ECF64B
MSKTFSFLLAALLAAGAQAQVITIDQNKALAGGVTPGDAPGFPVTISQPGSYRLTGNLNVPSHNYGAIQVTTEGGVTLDLGGFVVRGTRCSGTLCNIITPEVHGISGVNVRIHDGWIENFAGWGFYATLGGFRTVIERVFVANNGSGGIAASGYSLVQDSRITQNQGIGLTMLSGIVRGNVIAGNTQAQLRGSNGTVLVSGNTLLGPVPFDANGTAGPISMNDNVCAATYANGQRC